jgi:signal transduction histidine kinase
MLELLIRPWPRFLLTLSTVVRLLLCFLCFFFCITLYFLSSNMVGCDAFLIFPGALGAWSFKVRGAWSGFLGTLAVLIISDTLHYHTLLWPTTGLLSLLIIIIIMIITGSILVSLRTFLDQEEQTRQRAEQTELEALVLHDKMRQLAQIRNQFVQNVNHELRTPLMAAYGYFEYLQVLLGCRSMDDPHTLAHSEYVENALRHCEELRTRVNQVLETMEIGSDSRPLPLQPIPIATTIQMIVNNTEQFRREKHRTQVMIPTNLNVLAQEQCLRHVLHNLFSNALKYSPPDTPIVVSAIPYGEQEQHICIRVRDAGPGIPPEESPLIFDRFVRLPRDIGSPIHGTGTGLYICKHLIHVMQGEIWVESQGIAGQGSCFCFTLPRAS